MKNPMGALCGQKEALSHSTIVEAQRADFEIPSLKNVTIKVSQILISWQGWGGERNEYYFLHADGMVSLALME